MIKLAYGLERLLPAHCIIIPCINKNGTIREILSQYNIRHIDAILNDLETNGDGVLIYNDTLPEQRILLIKLEVKQDLAKWKKTVIEFISKNKKCLQQGFAIDFSAISKEISGSAMNSKLECISLAVCLSTYSLNLYKKESMPLKDLSGTLYFGEVHEDQAKALCSKIQALYESMVSVMNLVNAPSNFKTTETMVAWAKNSSEQYHYELEVLEKKDLQRLGLHALLAVNQGSVLPARCIIAKHFSASKNAITIALVGKGVTFDTGGISLKRSNNMHYMKSDMGGAAAVLGAIEVSARLKMDVNLIAVVPTTDNSIGSNAIKPGDVINSYHGSTIEVIDTDAEGRLVLADGLCYVNRNFKPDILIDLATLTGSIVQSLGTVGAGLMTKNEDLIAQLTKAANSSGDKLWPMPMWDEFREAMDSDIADIKNLSDIPVAGAITAAMFLEHFTEEHPAYAHLDIAGTAFHKMPYGKSYSATGFGVNLLVNWIESLLISTDKN